MAAHTIAQASTPRAAPLQRRPNGLVLLVSGLLAFRPVHVLAVRDDPLHMNVTAAIRLVLVGYLTLAAVQDGPMQVWLLVLAPFALIAIALVLHIAEYSKHN
jgi:hypothetical protein